MSQAAAQEIACPHCGGTFAIASATSLVSCPFCHRQFESQALGSAQSHARQYAAHQAEAQDHRQWADIHSSRNAPAAPTVRWVVLLMVPIIGASGLAALSGAGAAELISPTVWRYAVVAISVLTTIGIGLSVVLSIRRAFAAGAEPVAVGQQVEVSCPNCGAPAQMTHGQAVENCSYCGSALVPGAELMASALDAARLQIRHELFRSARAERQANLRLDKQTSGGFGLFLLLPVALVIVGAIELVVQQNISTAVVTWGSVIVAAAVVGIRQVVRVTRTAALRRSFFDIAAQLRGQLLDFGQALQWLDSFWPGSILETFWLNNHRTFVSLTANIYGYACYVQLLPVNSYPFGGYAVVLVACSFDERFPPMTAQTKAIKKWLKQHRFDLHIEEGGLSAVRDLKKSPAYWSDPASAHSLATVAAQLAHMAHLLGGRSVPPMP